MPGRSKTRKTRKTRKPTLRKAKAVVRRAKRVAKKSNSDTFAATITTNVALVPTQGVSVANYLYTCFNLFDTNAPSWSVGVLPEFKMYCNMYDRVRINGIRIRATPKANVFGQDAAQNDASLNLTGDNMIHTAIDRTGAAPGNIKQIAKYPSYRQYNQRKPFTRYYGVKYPRGVWFQTTSLTSPTALPASVTTPGIDMGLFGGITLYAENFVEENGEIFNEPWANVKIDFYCVFQGKALNTITYDAAGIITLSLSLDLHRQLHRTHRKNLRRFGAPPC